MRSTMQDTPLTVPMITRHGQRVHGRTAEVVTLGPTGVRRSSFAEVGADAARLAHGLRDLGITGDDRVATFMWNNAEHVAAYLAVPSMGAVLHTLNIRLPANQLVYIVAHGDDKVLLVDGSLLPALAPLLPKLPTVRHVVVTGDADLTPVTEAGKTGHHYADLLAGRPDTFDWPDVDERSAAGLCYSSGTTGDPKGVAYSHRSTVLHAMAISLGDATAASPTDRVLAVVPMFHVMAWGLPYAAYLMGSSLIMPDRFLQPEPLARLIQGERVTMAGAVPSVWTGLLHYADAHPEVDLTTMQKAIVGGSACPRSLMEGFDRHGVRVIHAWGMTETSPIGTVALPPPTAEGEERWRYRVSQGRFVSLVEGRIMRPDGSEAPWDGESVGELEVRGPWIAGAYHTGPAGAGGKPAGAGSAAADVAAAGVSAPPAGTSPDAEDEPAAVGAESFHDGWLRTGDVGFVDADGFLTLTDRAKDVIKSGGEWISSVDLENILMAHQAVAEASVVGVPDEQWGERPLATVVVREGANVTAVELRDFLAGRVPRWQVPERFAFITEVPKTSVGKFDKKVLRRRYADGELAVTTVARPAP